MSGPRRRCDVVVLGGGLAGLTLAIQILRRRPGTSITVLEKRALPVREAAHKVGESSLEIGADYYAEVLGLADHIRTCQLPKYGLRFFCRADPRSPIPEGFELGTTAFAATPSFQFDRGIFENFLASEARRLGVDLVDGCRVRRVELRPDGEHTVEVGAADGRDTTLSARWVVDAAGRPGMLKRRLGLEQDVDHRASAAWFRLAARVDIETWYDDPRWVADGRGEGERYLSTNHLMGRGYWVWLIPLSSGATSIGIVADSALHPLSGFNSLPKALAWLDAHEPDCARAVRRALAGGEHVLRDFLAVKHYSHTARHVWSGDRWALTGDAGVFLDPLYSPGSDFIATSNTLITDLVCRELAGEEVGGSADRYEQLYFRLFRDRLAAFEGQYGLLGNMRVMPLKVLWDWAYYWAVSAPIWFNGKLTDRAALAAIDDDWQRASALNLDVQRFLREWDAGDRRPGVRGYVDPSRLDVLRRLNHRGGWPLATDAFAARVAANVAVLHELAAEIVAAAPAGVARAPAGLGLATSRHLAGVLATLSGRTPDALAV